MSQQVQELVRKELEEVLNWLRSEGYTQIRGIDIVKVEDLKLLKRMPILKPTMPLPNSLLDLARATRVSPFVVFIIQDPKEQFMVPELVLGLPNDTIVPVIQLDVDVNTFLKTAVKYLVDVLKIDPRYIEERYIAMIEEHLERAKKVEKEEIKEEKKETEREEEVEGETGKGEAEREEVEEELKEEVATKEREEKVEKTPEVKIEERVETAPEIVKTTVEKPEVEKTIVDDQIMRLISKSPDIYDAVVVIAQLPESTRKELVDNLARGLRPIFVPARDNKLLFAVKEIAEKLNSKPNWYRYYNAILQILQLDERQLERLEYALRAL